MPIVGMSDLEGLTEIGKKDPDGIVTVTVTTDPSAIPAPISTGAVESEHRVAEEKVVLSGQYLSVVVLIPAHVTVIAKLAVSIVPEFLMKAN